MRATPLTGYMSRPTDSKVGTSKKARPGLPPPDYIASAAEKRPIRYCRNSHGVFIVPPKNAPRICPECGLIHYDGERLTLQQYNERTKVKLNNSFREFVWKPPVVFYTTPAIKSKNARRKASGKRTGERKNRKRTPNGDLRKPNDWPAIRAYRNAHNCAECKKYLHVYARRIFNRPHRVLLFVEGEAKSVLYMLWYFRFEMKRLHGIQFGGDLIFLIMSTVYTKRAIEVQRLKKDQVFLRCGCIYHVSCYGKLAEENVHSCKAHKSPFP